jgi:hypothetical protein
VPTIQVTPAVFLRGQLADARRRGVSFTDAWPDALRAALASAPNKCDRDQWSDVLNDVEMIATWRSAYTREPASAPEHAFVLLRDPERVPMPDRPCNHCGEEIPSDRGKYAPALYCGDDCRRAAALVREHERVAV